MLKCKDVAGKASDYHDGSLPLSERLGMKLHLFMCSHCRRFMRHLALSLRYLSGIGNRLLGLPEDRARQIADRTRDESDRKQEE